MVLFAALCLCLVAPPGAFALEDAEVQLSEGRQSLLEHSEYLVNPGPAWSLAELRAQHLDELRPLTAPIRSWEDSNYWLRVRLHWPPGAPDVVGELHAAQNVGTGQAYVLHEGHPALAWALGDLEPPAKRFMGAGHAAFPLRAHPGTTTVVWLRVKGNGKALELALDLVEAEQYARSHVRWTALNWLFLGALFMLALYQLLMYVGSRDRASLFYVGVVLCTAAVELTGKGHIQQVWAFEHGPMYGKLMPSATALMAVFWCLFTREALDTAKLAPRLHGILLWSALSGVAVTALSALVPSRAALILYSSFCMPVMVLCLTTGFVTWKRGCKPARLYLVTWGVMYASVAVGVFGGLQAFLPQLGILFQIMGFALVLAQRVSAVRKGLREAELREVEAQRERLAGQASLLQAQERTIAVEKEAAETLQQKVDHRTRELAERTAEAEQARARVEELDRQKTQFFQNISHEIRTPLTLVLNPLEDLAQEQPEEGRLQLAERNARRLLRLVNQLLDFQKLQAGKKSLHLENVDLVRFAWVCGDYVRNVCADRGISFLTMLDGEDLQEGNLGEHQRFIQGEVDALEKVVFNYLSNALKFTPDGGEIRLEICTEGAQVRVAVVDSGPGISAANRGKLFELFSQVDGSASREVEGTGLGLALAKELTEAMQGEVGLESQVGQGSRFWSIFPSMAPPAHEQDAAPLDDFQVKPWLLADQPRSDHIPSDGLELETGGGQRVLVVDDLADMRDLISSTLRRNGYQVRTARDGFEGLRHAQKAPPELIITDWMMPKKTGIELLKELRADATLQHLPVVLLTARSDEEGKLLGTEVGADAFLGKPFNEQELCATVRNLLALKDREKQVEALATRLREDVLKRYLPPTLVDQIVADDSALGAVHEARAITVLFADLCGFTKLARTLRAAAMARLLNTFLGKMTEVVFAHGGTIDKFIGDGMMVFFGAPEVMDTAEQARRAVACSLAMQKAMEELNQAWEQEGTGPLKLRVGVHHGPAVVGNFGSERRLDYTAIGDTVNMASRIENQVDPGQILLSGSTADLLPEDVVEEAGSFSLKGVEHPTTLFRVRPGASASLDEDAA